MLSAKQQPADIETMCDKNVPNHQDDITKPHPHPVSLFFLNPPVAAVFSSLELESTDSVHMLLFSIVLLQLHNFTPGNRPVELHASQTQVTPLENTHISASSCLRNKRCSSTSLGGNLGGSVTLFQEQLAL